MGALPGVVCRGVAAFGEARETTVDELEAEEDIRKIYESLPQCRRHGGSKLRCWWLYRLVGDANGSKTGSSEE